MGTKTHQSIWNSSCRDCSRFYGAGASIGGEALILTHAEGLEPTSIHNVTAVFDEPNKKTPPSRSPRFEPTVYAAR
jgi:hypothetical protein